MRRKRQKIFTELDQAYSLQMPRYIPENKQNNVILPLINYKQSWKTMPVLPQQGLRSLQSQLQYLLFNSKKKLYEAHQQKITQDNKKKFIKRMKQQKKQIQKHQKHKKFKLLQNKLNQLKQQMKLQRRKLQLQQIYEQKMNNKQEKMYDKLHQRYRKKHVVDCSLNTEPINIDDNSNSNKTDRRQSIIINKNVQEIINNNQVKRSKQKKNKKQKKPMQKKGKKRFRIAVYAVIFSIRFPRYSKLFSQKRKQYFNSQVTLSNLNFQLQNIYDLLENLNIKSMIQQANKKYNREENATSIQFKQVTQSKRQVNIQFKFQNIPQILINLLKRIRDTIKTNLVNPFLKILSQLLLTRSFVLDHFYIQQQLFRLHFNPIHSCLQLNIQQQTISIINFIMIKVIAFQFLINCDKQKQQGEEINYIFDKQDKNDQLNPTQIKQLILVGAYLAELCNMVNFKVEIDQESCLKGNIQQIEQQYLPMTELIYQNPLQYQLNQSLKSTRQVVEKKDFLRPYIQIRQLDPFKKIIQGLKKKNKRQQQALDIIVQIRKELYQKLKMNKKSIYKQLKQNLYKEDDKIQPQQKQQKDKQNLKYLSVFYTQRNNIKKYHQDDKSSSQQSTNKDNQDKESNNSKPNSDDEQSQQKRKTRLLFEASQGSQYKPSNKNIQSDNSDNNQNKAQSSQQPQNDKNSIQNVSYPQIDGPLPQKPQKPNNKLRLKRMSSNNNYDNKINQQNMKRRLKHKNSLMKMSNKQFSS